MQYIFKNFPEPGLAVDSVKLLTMKLNPRHIWIQSTLMPSSYEQDETYINALLNSFPSPDPKFYLFVFLSKTKPVCFLTSTLLKQLQNDFDSFSFRSFLSYFDDINLVKNNILSHYLGQQDYSHVDIEALIRQNDSIPDKIKMLLFGFILEPQRYLTDLKNQLTLYYDSFKKEDRNFPHVVLDIFQLKSMLKSSIPDPDYFLDNLSSPVIRYSICISTPNHLQFDLSHPLWIIFSKNSLLTSCESLTSLASDYLINLGDALRNTNRISILRLLQVDKYISLSELSSSVNLTTSTLLHHLSILKKAKIITEQRQGKQAVYSLNPDGLLYASKVLSNLSKGEHLT